MAFSPYFCRISGGLASDSRAVGCDFVALSEASSGAALRGWAKSRHDRLLCCGILARRRVATARYAPLRAIACLCVLVRIFCCDVDVALMLGAQTQKAPLSALCKWL
ncbi:MAG: hypothetical protein H9533_11410 [Rhodobacteraceae bacterium]|nr:hypothetical protein [Paracoccaceae bacterium]